MDRVTSSTSELLLAEDEAESAGVSCELDDEDCTGEFPPE